MAAIIRLQRKGSTHRPFYHVVVTDSRNARDGRFIEKLGYYDPKGQLSTVELKEDRVKHWYGLGAEISDTCAKLAKIKNISLVRNKSHVISKKA